MFAVYPGRTTDLSLFRQCRPCAIYSAVHRREEFVGAILTQKFWGSIAPWASSSPSPSPFYPFSETEKKHTNSIEAYIWNLSNLQHFKSLEIFSSSFWIWERQQVNLGVGHMPEFAVQTTNENIFQNKHSVILLYRFSVNNGVRACVFYTVICAIC